MTTTNISVDVGTITTLMPENATRNDTGIYVDAEMANMRIYEILIPLIWGILTVIGALGNALVIFTLVRHGDKNATNYFVINLAISDFAFLVIVLPFTATLYALPSWIFGNGMCKITMYMIYNLVLERTHILDTMYLPNQRPAVNEILSVPGTAQNYHHLKKSPFCYSYNGNYKEWKGDLSIDDVMEVPDTIWQYPL